MKETVVHVWDDLAQANGEKVTATGQSTASGRPRGC
jgi:hypothetical protein